jgi:HSP20 family protein
MKNSLSNLFDTILTDSQSNSYFPHDWLGIGRLNHEAISFDYGYDDTNYYIVADVPGYTDKIEIFIKDNLITISGQRVLLPNFTFITNERKLSSFSRSFRLPEAVDEDKISSTLKDGILTITIPRRPSISAKQIPVTRK